MKRSGIKRKKARRRKAARPKGKRKGGPRNAKPWRDEADRLWREAILQRDGHQCAVCGDDRSGLNAHHLISRRIASLRHELENGIALCPKCHQYDPHLSAHGGPLGFAQWLEMHRPAQWLWVRDHRGHTGSYNYREAFERLGGEVDHGGQR